MQARPAPCTRTRIPEGPNDFGEAGRPELEGFRGDRGKGQPWGQPRASQPRGPQGRLCGGEQPPEPAGVGPCAGPQAAPSPQLSPAPQAPAAPAHPDSYFTEEITTTWREPPPPLAQPAGPSRCSPGGPHPHVPTHPARGAMSPAPVLTHRAPARGRPLSGLCPHPGSFLPPRLPRPWAILVGSQGLGRGPRPACLMPPQTRQEESRLPKPQL